MNPIVIKNQQGETIEIKCDSDGVIYIKHSDINPKEWGELHEYTKRLRQSSTKEYFDKNAPQVNLDSPEAKQIMGALGGYMVIDGKSYMINGEELGLIHAAVKQSGGIIPNWSNRP